jgi:hypothetical protein
MLQGVTRIPPHRVLDSGATTTVLAGEHHRYFTQYETAPDSHVMATAARGGTLEIAAAPQECSLV